MLDVFTEEIEVTVKHGIANLYWYRSDLVKALIRSGVSSSLAYSLLNQNNEDGSKFSKRQIMDSLYAKLRDGDFNRRLEVSRNLVRVLVEHKSFSPQDPKHRIEEAERCALKLKQIISEQQRDRSQWEREQTKKQHSSQVDYFSELETLQKRFNQAFGLPPQKRGYELEKIITDLMRISSIPVESPFKILGEQIDGAIKYDGHYYLLEVKWLGTPAEPKDIGAFYFKVDGKLGARGLFVSMSGYSSGVLESVPKGKDLKVLLIDGRHVTNVISGIYRMQELLDHAIKQATLRGVIFPPYELT